jgi:hypothetical protein
LVKELEEAGIPITINQLIHDMSRIKRVHTFFDDLNNPAKVTSFTLGNEAANKIDELYHLKDKYRYLFSSMPKKV